MVTIVIFWGLSPLQSAIFNTSTVDEVRVGMGNLHGGLSDITEGAAGLNLSFVHKAYDVVWLNQSLPSFTTLDAVYIPFSTTDESILVGSNRTFTAKTLMLSTSIQCAPASVYDSSSPEPDSSQRSGSPKNYTFDGHFGCTVNMSAPFCSDGDDSYCFSYLGYQTDLGTSLNCPVNTSNLYLATMAAPKLEYITAEFCQPSYWIQTVDLTVRESDMAVVSTKPLAAPSKLSYDDFNATEFQAIIWTGRLGLSLGDMWEMLTSNGNLLDNQNQLYMDWRLSTLGMNLKGSFMAGFAVGITRLDSAEAYMERLSLISSLQKAHSLLFSIAVNSILSSIHNESTPVAVTAIGSIYAISVVRPLTIAIEILLGCSVVGILLLLWISAKRTSCLIKDPASITAVASMLELADNDSESSNVLSVVIHNSNGGRFSLRQNRHWNVPEQFSYRPIDKANESSGQIIPSEVFQRPFYLGPIAGLNFVALLLGSIGALVVLRMLIDRDNGLPLPSQNDVVIQIVLSYTPVVFSTFLEPYWLLLNRMLCLLQPFKELKDCRAEARHSLDIRYSSLPPPLVLLRALRAKHYLLTAVCSISLLANVLTVGLGALLSTGPTFLITDNAIRAKNRPLINSTASFMIPAQFDYQDFFYVAESNLSSNTSLPPWTSKETYFLPMFLDSDPMADVTVNTYGFHAALSCNEITVQNCTYSEPYSAFSFNTSVLGPGGQSIDCYFNQAVHSSDGEDSKTQVGFETIAPLWSSDPGLSGDEAATCASAFSVVYQRGAGGYTPSTFNSTSSLYLVCQPSLEISNYSVQVSPSGHVLSSTRLTRPASDLSAYFARPNNVSDFYININQMVSWVYSHYNEPMYWSEAGSQVRLHNDSYAYDWFPFLISELLGSKDTVNTSLPAPSAATMIPAVSALYSQLVATIFSLYHDTFFPFPAAKDATIQATIRTPETRVFMSDAMLYLCGTVLVLDVLVAIAYYWHRPQQILPYMPTTVASVICTFEGSSLAGARGVWDADWRFGFGKFIGIDGKLRVGIERQPFVQSLPKKLQKSDLDPLTA